MNISQATQSNSTLPMPLPSLLLVGKDFDNLLPVISCSECRLVCATSIPEVVSLRMEGPILIAILSDSIGSKTLCEAAQCVSCQWPLAFVLIAGVVPDTMEDHLYEEAIDLRDIPKIIRDVIARLVQRNQLRISSLLGLKFKPSPFDINHGFYPVPPPQESDPTKTPVQLEQMSTSRGLPASECYTNRI
jgi:hypothetical protein